MTSNLDGDSLPAATTDTNDQVERGRIPAPMVTDDIGSAPAENMA
jgi:hypothetical protein